MKNETENTQQVPTFEQVPAMLAELTRKFDMYVTSGKDQIQPVTETLPMGVTLCAEFLSEIEGKEVTTGAVYNRVAKGLIPFRKNGARLLFLKEEILAAMLSRKVNRVLQFHEMPS
jgi:hypothetical protein